MTSKFGWCLDGHHTTCPIVSNSGTCSCECHEFDSSKKEAA